MATLFRKRFNGNWYINYRWNGRQIKKSTGTADKKLAEIKLKELEVAIFKGAYEPFGAKPKQNSIVEFFKRYINFSKTTKSASTNLSDLYRIKQIQEYFARQGIKYLEEVNPGKIQLFQSFILTDHNARSYNNFLTLLKSIFNKAVEWGVIKENLIKSCKPLKVPKSTRFFSIEEISELREVANSEEKLLLNLALYAGLRRSELYYLRWVDIDLKRKVIHIRPHGEFIPKNKKPGIVPINLKLFKILKEIYPKGKISEDNIYIFGQYHKENWTNPTLVLSKMFDRLAKKAGIKNVGLHICRHTFASHLVQAGIPLLVVKELMRHSDIQSTMVYAHLAPDQQRQAIENLKY